jgi:hypothetical protein
MSHTHTFISVAAVLCLTLSACAYASPAPVVVDARRQLFLDDTLVASRSNVRRVTQQASKFAGNPVLTPDEPWENNFAIDASVLRENGRYRAWYSTWNGVAYAESRDGIHWAKPHLNIVRVDGRQTNFVLHKTAGGPKTPTYAELFGVLRDDKDPNPQRRYKMGFLSIEPFKGQGYEDTFHKGQRRGLGVATSPDGIHWSLANAFATEAICDGMTTWMRDPASGKWVLYGRTQETPPAVQAAWSKYPWYAKWHWGRAVARVESPDFLTWDYSRPASAPVVMAPDLDDVPGTEIYSMFVFPYESVYIGLVQRYIANPDHATLDYVLAVSHDGVHFTRVEDRQPFMALGGTGEWDRFIHVMSNSPPIEVGDDLRFYYDGRPYRHEPYDGKDSGPMTGAIGFATVKRDRFVALEASFDGGTFETPPLLLKNGALHVNARSDAGTTQVEALDAGGKVVARARPIQTDGLDIPVEWETGSRPERGVPLRLRFTLRNAQLFALWSPVKG